MNETTKLEQLEELAERFNDMIVEPGDFAPEWRESKNSHTVGRQYVRRKLHTAVDTLVDSME